MTQMAATAKLLGMRVVGTMAIATLTKDWGDYNTSSAQITQRIQDLSVDMVVILNTFEGQRLTRLETVLFSGVVHPCPFPPCIHLLSFVVCRVCLFLASVSVFVSRHHCSG